MILGSPGGVSALRGPFLMARKIGPELLVGGNTKQSMYTGTSVSPSATAIKPILAPPGILSTCAHTHINVFSCTQFTTKENDIQRRLYRSFVEYSITFCYSTVLGSVYLCFTFYFVGFIMKNYDINVAEGVLQKMF